MIFFKKTGYAVDRQGYGKISFSPKDINYAMNYADTPAEQAAIAVLPQVLKRGIEIGRHADHKGRQKNTATFAAPVELNGTRGNMAVVVNRNGDHYYAHRIVMPDGTAFVFSDEKENATREPSRGVTVSSSLAKTISVASADSIPDTAQKSNTQNGDKRESRKSVADAEAREAALLQENDLLSEEIKYWKAQLERTPEENVGIVDPNAVRKTAKKLIEDYGSTLAHGDITNELQDLYNLMGTGSDERGELSYESAREIADSVARKIAENAVDDTESAYRMYEDLRSLHDKYFAVGNAVLIAGCRYIKVQFA